MGSSWRGDPFREVVKDQAVGDLTPKLFERPIWPTLSVILKELAIILPLTRSPLPTLPLSIPSAQNREFYLRLAGSPRSFRTRLPTLLSIS